MAASLKGLIQFTMKNKLRILDFVKNFIKKTLFFPLKNNRATIFLYFAFILHSRAMYNWKNYSQVLCFGVGKKYIHVSSWQLSVRNLRASELPPCYRLFLRWIMAQEEEKKCMEWQSIEHKTLQERIKKFEGEI